MAVCHIPAETWTGREDPEDGAEARRLHYLQAAEGPIGLLGFACDAGVVRNQGRPGAAEGPAAIRKAMANLAAPFNSSAFKDLGDIRVSDNDLEAGQKQLAGTIAQTAHSLDRLVILGGGHETAYGSWQGLKRAYPDKTIGIINFDAHLDIRQPGDAGPSSGTPFYQIHEDNPESFDYLVLGVAEEANTQALMERARDWNVSIVTDRALTQSAHAAIAPIESIIQRNDLIYLTICLDGLPGYQAPGVSAPAARGVPLSVLEAIIDQVLASAETRSILVPLIDIVELCPAHDLNGLTTRVAANLARTCLFRH